MKGLCLLVPALTLAVYAQESAFQEIEAKGKKGNFQETLEIREVRESSAKDVGEALTKVEGLWKLRKGGIANDVVLRGFQRDNLNVLIDGVRIYGACPNGMDPAAFHVDFAEIQEVEITKGGYDVRNNGSLGGAVNIINKTPAQGFRVTPNLAAGSFGFFNPSMTGSYTNDRLYVLGGESFRQSQPYRDGAGLRFTERTNYRPGVTGLNAFDINTMWSRFGYAVSPKQRLEAAYTGQRGDAVLYPYLLMDAAYDNADRASASYAIEDVLGPIKRLRLQGYFTRVNHWMTDERRLSSVGLARPYSMAAFADTKTLGGRLEAEFENLTAGIETYRRNWNAVNTMRMGMGYMDQHALPDVDVTVAGVYADYRRVLLSRLELNAGGRLDAAWSAARDTTVSTDLFWAYKGTRSLDAADMNPSGNLRLSYSLPKGFEVFTGVAHSARVPTPQERYYTLRRSGSDWVGNPLLKPVRNTETDLGFIYRHRRFYLRPTVFYSRLSDFIVVHNQPRLFMLPGVMNSTARSYANLPAEIYGGELSYSFGISERLLLFGGVSAARGLKDSQPQERIFDRHVSEMPPLKSRLAVRYGTRLFFGEVEGIGVWAQRLIDADLREQPTAGYGLLNAKCGIHTKKLNLALGLDNVTNRFYYEAYSYQRDPFRTGTKVPEPGRTVFVNASYGF